MTQRLTDPVQDWAESTTEQWAKEAKDQWKRHQRSQTMVRVRAKKKKQLEQLRRERRDLEHEMKLQLNKLPDTQGSASSAMYRLSIEGESLREENATLRHELQKHDRLLSMSSQALVTIASYSEEDSVPQTVREASKKTRRTCHNEEGWRVCFPNGEPSFYFQPFTRFEFDEVMKTYDNYLLENPHSTSVGQIFGWNVSHSPVERRPDGSVLAHARFTTQVGCSLEDVDSVITSSDIDAWPLLVTPPEWRNGQRRTVNSQVLQELDRNLHVMVLNLPGKTHSRFFQLTRRQVSVDEESGQRSVLFVAVAADSEANGRCRTAEAPQEDVKWIHEGGHSIKFAEGDKGTVNIVYDHKAICENELHARHLYIRWAHYVATCYWSEKIRTPKLLKTK